MLCDKGADPNGVLNRKPCAVEGYRCGADAVAMFEVERDDGWLVELHEDTPHLKPVLQALLDAGADPTNAWITYSDPPPCLEGQFTREEALCREYVLKRQAELHQRLVNASAIASLVAYWRHITYMPGSKAARAAISRCAKRARA